MTGPSARPSNRPSARPSNRAVHFVVPEVVADPTRPSGGNAYDRRLSGGLRELGVPVHEHLVPGRWPEPTAADRAALAGALAAVPSGATVLVDGLVASAAPDTVTAATARSHVVVLVHLPLGVTDAARRPAEAAMLRRMGAVVATSAWTRSWLLEEYAVAPDRVVVAVPGTDPAELASGSRTGGSLLCVGAVTPVKGHDLLVEALATLEPLPWFCTCVGSTDLDPEFVGSVRARLFRDGLADRVAFTGVLTGASLDAAYRAADVLVLPSRLETYGMVVTEALARGLPVIGFRTGGVPETLGRAADGAVPGALVPAGDPATLAATLGTWLADASVQARMRESARLRRDSLPSWGETAARVAAVLGGRVAA
jgi:glycosyltransferase involved in cell wall biosynthesis